VIERDRVFRDKARESLAGGVSEFVNHQYNNSANRSYYAVYQAAIHALLTDGIRPPGATNHWGHDYVQAQFVGQLINRRKRYSADLRHTLEQNYRLREAADYRRDPITEVRAARAARRAETFVIAVGQDGGEAS
jgi:uncharacterized protein (UPF0332 family)